MKKFYLIIVMIFSSSLSYALEGEFQSSNKKTHLIELFTSQSCSSCPPAEKWLNRLKNFDRLLWVDYVPVEFHVDYWNHLSWKDPFSKAQYTQRQYEYNKVIKKGVYTPQLILSGKDWRSWRSNKAPTKAKEKPGVLSVNIKGNSATLTFNSLKKLSSRVTCNFAISSNKNNTEITSGENKGKLLRHEYRVTSFQSTLANKKDQQYTCRFTLREQFIKEATSVSAWVSNSKDLTVIQATGRNL